MKPLNSYNPKIVTFPDPVLTTPTEDVSVEEIPLLSSLILEMIDRMYEARGIGLAANQVGVGKRLCILDTSWPDGKKNPRIYINPKIINFSNEIISEEGCLSIPGVVVKKKRYRTVTVEYYDMFGVKHMDSLSDLDAFAIQHECDHLDGKTLFDGLDPIYEQAVQEAYKNNNNRSDKEVSVGGK